MCKKQRENSNCILLLKNRGVLMSVKQIRRPREETDTSMHSPLIWRSSKWLLLSLTSHERDKHGRTICWIVQTQRSEVGHQCKCSGWASSIHQDTGTKVFSSLDSNWHQQSASVRQKAVKVKKAWDAESPFYERLLPISGQIMNLSRQFRQGR